ncbi:hypothetical protein F4803DRAFT_250010 [Xylaria telfairii]|nr:hypothetical protein F4803DRAFT_250010 [Xylaria telfairii]
MSTSQQKARRKGGPRSKGGCGICKARHLKCDETKPHCRRCSETGAVCDGYPTAVPNNQVATALVSTPIAAYAIPFRIPGSQQDRRLLHYYCVQGAEDLSGHLSSEFWTCLVLQHSHDNITVRQAVVALSCAHQNYITTTHSGNLTSPTAMVHYSKAMRSLRKYMSAGIDDEKEVSAIIPLICSVLFFCFENTQGNTEAAIRHLNSGIAILARHKKGGRLLPDSHNPEHLDLLEQTLARLDLQASMFDDARLPLIRLGSTVESETLASRTFKSIDDAQADLTRLQNRMLQFLISNNQFKFCPEHDLPEELMLEKQAIEEAYAKWNEKLDEYGHDQSISTKMRTSHHASSEGGEEEGHLAQVLETEAAGDPGVAILRIYYYVFQLLLAANFPYDPSVFTGACDSVNAYKLNKILDLIESTPQGQERGGRSLAVETGIIPPLFLVVIKCTDAVIFKRAFGLLSALSGRREGMFDSRVLAEIAFSFMSQYQTPCPPTPLEWQVGNALDESVNGLEGVAKNLGVIP